MNWIEEAKDKLLKYEEMKLAVDTIPQDLDRLERECFAIGSARTDRISAHSEGAARRDILLDKIAARQILAADLQNATAWVHMVDRTLEILRREDQLVLTKVYITPEKGAVEYLCTELGIESSSIYRRRDKAIETFALAMYGTTGEEWLLRKVGKKREEVVDTQ